jgi:hypothetical protein
MNKNKKIQNRIIIVLCLIILTYGFVNSVIGDYLLRTHSNCIKAQIYKETYGGKTHPSYGYVFILNQKKYKGLMVKTDDLEIGDSICVVFLKSFPNINRPLSYFDEGKIKCDCNH